MASTDAPVRVLGLCGSLREHSVNRGLLIAAGDLLPEGARLDVPELTGLPEFNEDLERQGEPDRVRDIKAQIASAHVLLFAVPEYNYALPGWFKNVFDWVSRPVATTPLRHKPTGILSASLGERGGARAQMALRLSLVYTDSYVMARPELFVGKAGSKCDASGRLIDPATREELRAYLTALLTWAARVGPT
jgi:chromate reductase, NAD(P)H dehydrogenase (quinone)